MLKVEEKHEIFSENVLALIILKHYFSIILNAPKKDYSGTTASTNFKFSNVSANPVIPSVVGSMCHRPIKFLYLVL